MKRKRTCRHCRRLFIPVRNPQQQFCSRRFCQTARKSSWRREKRKNDSDYRSNQRRANQRWQACHPDYWKQYRAVHQKYVQRNREKQRVRDGAKIQGKWHVKGQGENLAKGDALHGKNIINTGNYWIIPVLANTLAKSDALFVKIDPIPTG